MDITQRRASRPKTTSPSSPHTPTPSSAALPSLLLATKVESKFSPDHSSRDVFASPSHSERDLPVPLKPATNTNRRAASTPPETTNDSRTRLMRRGTPGDLPSVATLQQSWDRQQLSKKKSQFFSDSFAYREPKNPLRERVSRDSVIVAELKLSGALDEDTSVVSDFSFLLAQIFQRPESCIFLTVQDSTLLLFGGSFEPAYLLSVSALASELAPTKNKRTTALVQQFIHESLGISAKRGVVRFSPITEENLGTNGLTTLGEIEELERSTNEDGNMLRSISRNRSRRAQRGAMPERSKTAMELTPPESTDGPQDNNLMTPGMDRKRLRRRKSFMAFFGIGG